jgi:tryptophan synthase alpha chain
MNRIDAKFAELDRQKRTALIPFVEAGDPDLATTFAIVRMLEKNGADLIELGVPFSDPMADGPTIQRSSERALKAGATLPRVLELVRKLRKKTEIPIVLFGYYNPIFHYGARRLAKDAKNAGVDGVLCVDLPPEESAELKTYLDKEELDLIFLLAPTSDEERIRRVARQGKGFVYYVSVTGVTGARSTVEDQLPSQVERIRRYTSLPVGVGFGISTPDQAAWIASFADAAVVGSALISVIERERKKSLKAEKAGRFVAGLKRAMNGRRGRVSKPSRV